MAKKSKVVEVAKEYIYDSSKKYQWQSNAEITLSGIEFDLIYKALVKFSNGSVTDMSSILALVTAANVAQSKLVEYVKKGIIVEANEA